MASSDSDDDDGSGIFALLFLAGFIFYAAMYARYRNKEARHTYEKETKKNLSNIIKKYEFIKHEKGLKNASMKDRNDNKIEGDNIKIGKLAKLSNDIKTEVAAASKQNNK